MADKRISQLIERVDIANNDVLPIVASGATTTNKVTVSTLQDWMQENLDVGVTSVGLSMPSAFTVSNSPVTASGNISVTGAGTVSQYIRGDGSLADFPSSTGGGSSVSYYLNGSVNQGTIGGVAYRELSKSPIIGAGTEFTINANGYIASFITDAGDPSLLEIPGGNWNFETYLSASSGGGSPSFYVELYKVSSGGTATLIASNSGSPELIAFGTTINPYFSSLAVPTTTLALTDRLAIRYYVTHSGRTITLHTEDNHLCQIITTFTTGLTALNGLTAQVQNFATGTSGSDFNISSSTSTHTFNLPTASSTNRGALSSADWVTFNGKQDAGNYVTTDTTQTITGAKTFSGSSLRLAANGNADAVVLRNVSGTTGSDAGATTIGFNGSDNIFVNTQSRGGFILGFNNSVANREYTLQDASGTLAFTSQIPTNPVGGTGTTNQIPKFTASSTIGNSNLSDDGSAVTCSTELRVLGALNGTTASLTSTGTHLSLIRNTFNTFTFAVGTASGISGLLIGNNTAGTTPLIINQSNGAVTLSGALNGTSATFSTTSGFGINNKYTSENLELFFGTVAGGKIGIQAKVISSGNTYPLFLSPQGGGIDVTGAATFSSSVTAKSLKVENTGTASFLYFNNTSAPASNYIALGSAANEMYFQVNGADRLVIKDNGNVGIGTASPMSFGGFTNLTIASSTTTNQAALFLVNSNASIRGSFYTNGSTNVRLGTATSHDLLFDTADTERMRITSGGYLKATSDGTYVASGSNFHEMTATANGTDLLLIRHKGTDPYGFEMQFSGATPNNGTNWFQYFQDATAARFIVRSNGGLQNYQANDGNLSDERTKKDIEPLESYWDKFKAIEIVKFKYKDQTHDDFNIGVIAQQVEAVAPEFVDVDGWGKPELDEEGNEIVSEEEPLKSIYTADLYHATIKVLQEAMAKIEKLEAEIDSLKTK